MFILFSVDHSAFNQVIFILFLIFVTFISNEDQILNRYIFRATTISLKSELLHFLFSAWMRNME